MHILKTADALRQWREHLRLDQQRVGFVPTMGNLHAGHLSLVKHAQQHADQVIVSIFVNPLQFAAHEDLDNYPRTLNEDCAKLKQLGVDSLFVPSSHWLSTTPGLTTINPPSIAREHEGACRPDFFRGVCTIVSKLFNLVEPNLAVFGEKDFQQYCVIKQMVKDLSYPIDIQAGKIEREQDGLAMSSRNAYLTPQQRRSAPMLYQSLITIKSALEASFRNWPEQRRQQIDKLTQSGFSVDYLTLAHAETLLEPQIHDECILLIAAKLGDTRLIDNIRVRTKGS